MNTDEFIRNLRGINKGESLPPDYLRSLYGSISRNEIRITTDAADVHLSPIIWVELDQASRSERGQLLDIEPLSKPPLPLSSQISLLAQCGAGSGSRSDPVD